MDFALMIRLATRLLSQGKEISSALDTLASLRRMLDQMQRPQETEASEEHPYPEGSVAWLQDALNKLIGAELVADGDYGEKTRQAVSDYQGARGLTVDGMAGPQTVASIITELDAEHVGGPP